MKTITVTIQRDSGKINVDVPSPAEGKWSPTTDPKDPSPVPTIEQRAYYTFWQHGTRERIDELVKGNDGIAVRDTLVWLLNLRVTEVRNRVGFLYEVIVHEEPPTSVRKRVRT